MPKTDYGLGKIGSFYMNESVTRPTYICFGTGSTTFNATENHLNSEVEAVSVTRERIGNSVRYSGLLPTTHANGSDLGEIGVGVGSLCGSTLWSRDLSAIGEKNSTFSTSVYVTFKYERG